MKRINIKNKIQSSLRNGMIGDVIFKMIANVVQIILRNIIVLPAFASIFSNSEYGELVTVLGVITTISAGLGNSLLSTRLVMDADYRTKKYQGDFNLVCWIVSGISVLGVFVIAIFFPGQSLVNLLVIACVLFLETFNGYHSGWFVLKQAYRKLLVYTVVGGVGFGIGLLLTKTIGVWSLTYLCSDMFCFAFLMYLSPLVKENIKITNNLKITLEKYAILIISTIMANAIAYMDRLLLYPAIGSEAVSIYTTASVFGKAFNLMAIPISSILLGYYAVDKIQLTLKKYWIINMATLVTLIFFMIITCLFGRWFTGVLYPTLIEDATPYIVIANLSSALGASAQITKSAALKYAKLYWSLTIQGIYFILYICLGYRLVLLSGIKGFSYAVLITNILQLVMLYIICTISMKRQVGTNP